MLIIILAMLLAVLAALVINAVLREQHFRHGEVEEDHVDLRRVDFEDDEDLQ